tara:strand:+ start:1747 stop:2277 length:531 start_codon:yes stop_codon:yes gene_type:complete
MEIIIKCNIYMKKFIFDLDDTLYSPIEHESRDKDFYKNLKKDKRLTDLLKKTKENYIFTNGNKYHMEECIKRMKLKSLFKGYSYSDLFRGKYKPHILPYIITLERFKLNKNDFIFYFEDLADNLKTGKKLGWITIFIDHENKMRQKPKYIDMVFNNIYDAIETCLSLKISITKNSN